MRNIKVEAKTVDQAVDKGLQMLGISREEVEVKVINEGSMLKKACVEIYTFANAEEREEYLKNNTAKAEVKLVKTTSAEDETMDVNIEHLDEVTEIVNSFLSGILTHMQIEGSVSRGVRNGDVIFKILEFNE